MTKKKLSPTQRWMQEHPDDKPCPRTPQAAKAWRIARGLERTPAERKRHEKYQVALIEMRYRNPSARDTR
jgi:hypothetical protein